MAAAVLSQQQLQYRSIMPAAPAPPSSSTSPYVTHSSSSPSSSSSSPLAVQKAEQRRREQRRLSAQRRRERKRFTLNDLEIRLRQYQHTDTELREQLHISGGAAKGRSVRGTLTDLPSVDPPVLVAPVANSVARAPSTKEEDGTASPPIAFDAVETTSPASPTTTMDGEPLTEEGRPAARAAAAAASVMVDVQALLDAADQSVLCPSFPNWDDMLSRARQKAMGEAQEELMQERAAAAATHAVEPSRDKNTVRRERNRLSARMSRLRKRLRHGYLDTMLTMLSDRVHLLNEMLEKTNQKPISSIPDWNGGSASGGVAKTTTKKTILGNL